MKNDLLGLIFPCPTVNGSCSCPMPSSLTPQQCALAGNDILNVSGPFTVPCRTLATSELKLRR